MCPYSPLLEEDEDYEEEKSTLEMLSLSLIIMIFFVGY